MQLRSGSAAHNMAAASGSRGASALGSGASMATRPAALSVLRQPGSARAPRARSAQQPSRAAAEAKQAAPKQAAGGKAAPAGAGAGNGRGAPRGAAAQPTKSEAKLAVAAKISAARTLARKLAEEKQAAIAAARLASQQVARGAVAELAKEAARADALARAARKAESQGAPQLLELERLREENDALQALLLQLAADRREAEAKLQEVKAKYSLAVAEPAAAAELPAPPAPPPPAPPASEAEVVAAANKAREAGRKVATLPQASERGRGAFPRGPAGQTGRQRRVDALAGRAESDWWCLELPLPRLLFRADYVVMDAESGAVDNNG
eukprot:scaffold10.g2311.t1